MTKFSTSASAYQLFFLELSAVFQSSSADGVEVAISLLTTSMLKFRDVNMSVMTTKQTLSSAEEDHEMWLKFPDKASKMTSS